MSYIIPQWVSKLPEDIPSWLYTLRDDNYFCLFKPCVDTSLSNTIPASAAGVDMLMQVTGKSIFEFPDYNKEKLDKTIVYIRGLQNPQSGLFIDPHLEPFFQNRESPRALNDFHRAITKYAIGLLKTLGSEPVYEIAAIKSSVSKDSANEYLEYVKSGDWSRPWDTGSNAAARAVEIFKLICEGQEEFIPAFCESIEFILSKQNPQTGMWGNKHLPLYEQISGTLKIVGRFLWRLGIKLPYMDKLADSCIKYHSNKEFYGECDHICIPRNVAEMCAACLVISDYRRAELLETLNSIADYLYQYKMPDGAFASTISGTSELGWAGSHIVGQTNRPRSDISGTQQMTILGLIGDYLGWQNCQFRNSFENYQENIRNQKYKIYIDSDMKVRLLIRGK